MEKNWEEVAGRLARDNTEMLKVLNGIRGALRMPASDAHDEILDRVIAMEAQRASLNRTIESARMNIDSMGREIDDIRCSLAPLIGESTREAAMRARRDQDLRWSLTAELHLNGESSFEAMVEAARRLYGEAQQTTALRQCVSENVDLVRRIGDALGMQTKPAFEGEQILDRVKKIVDRLDKIDAQNHADPNGGQIGMHRDIINALGLDLTPATTWANLMILIRSARDAARQADAPEPMRLTCEKCSALHIDEGEFQAKPHHTHACQHCGHVWRPSIKPKFGVRFLPGFRNDDEAIAAGNHCNGESKGATKSEDADFQIGQLMMDMSDWEARLEIKTPPAEESNLPRRLDQIVDKMNEQIHALKSTIKISSSAHHNRTEAFAGVSEWIDKWNKAPLGAEGRADVDINAIRRAIAFLLKRVPPNERIDPAELPF